MNLTRPRKHLLTVPRLCAIIVILIASLVLFGWSIDNLHLKRIEPSLVAMNPLTAVCFILGGVALLFHTRGDSNAASVLALIVLAVGLLKLIEIVMGVNIGIDRILFTDQLEAEPIVNRMSPNTALGVVCSGAALYLTNTRPTAAQNFALLVIAIGTLSVIGYIFDVRAFYGVLTYIPMALHTAALFLILAIAIIALQVDTPLMRVWRSDTAGAVVMRRVLPASFLIPLVISALRLLGEKMGLYNTEFGVALNTTVVIALLIGVTWWTAHLLYNVDVQRQETERAMRESERRYRLLFENASDMIIVADRNGEHIDINRQAERALGYTREELRDPAMAEQRAALLPWRELGIEDIADWNEAIFGEYVIVRKDGRPLEVEYTANHITEAQYQAIMRDIGGRKQTERKLRLALEKERELTELRARFTSMLSHEFRTPLAVILSSTDLLARYSDRMQTDRRIEHLMRIKEQVDLLLAMLNDVLAIARADSVGVELHLEDTDIRDFVRRVIEELTPTVTKHRFDFRAIGDDFRTQADPKLLGQIVQNLLTNAVKYSPSADKVSVGVLASDLEIILVVQDFGIGISEGDLRALFEPFHRGKNVGEIQGTGLGLHIVKRAIEAHGGTIHVASKLNLGTTMTVHLPRRLIA